MPIKVEDLPLGCILWCIELRWLWWSSQDHQILSSWPWQDQASLGACQPVPSPSSSLSSASFNFCVAGICCCNAGKGYLSEKDQSVWGDAVVSPNFFHHTYSYRDRANSLCSCNQLLVAAALLSLENQREGLNFVKTSSFCSKSIW